MGVMLKSLLFVLTIVLALAGAAYWMVIQGKAPLDAEARAQAPGAFAALSDGQIHYRWHGPDTGPVIVMTHGFSTPNFIFEQNAEALAEQGYRVLTFDHFGRGWSDRPKGPYSVDFYDRALLELTETLGIDDPFGLVGLSMGGVIAAEFAARHPERVSKLALFVPAGLVLGGEAGSLNDRLLHTPVIGEWIWTVFGERILLGDSQYDEATLQPHQRLAGDVAQQMTYRGYFSALLSSYRHLPMRDRDDAFRRVADHDMPVLAIFGDADTTVLPESAARLEAAIPEAEIHMIAGGDHGVTYKMSETVNPIVTAFFAPADLTGASEETSLVEN